MVRSIAVLFFTQVGNLLAAIAFGIFLARHIGAEGQGTVQVAFFLPTVLALASAVGGGATLTYLAGRGVDHGALLGWLYGLALATLAVGVLSVYGLKDLFRPALAAGLSWNVVRWSFLFLPMQTLANGFSALFLADNRMYRVALMALLPRMAQLAAVIVALFFNILTVPLVFWLYVLAPGVPALLGLFFGYGRIRPVRQFTVWKRALGYGLRGHLGNVAQFLNYRVGLYLLGSLTTVRHAGWYWLSVTLSELLWLLPQAVAGSWLPRVARGQVQAKQTASMVRVLGWLTVGLAVIGGILAIAVVPAVWGLRFRPAVGILWGLLPGVALFTWSKVLAADLSGHGHPGWNTGASLAGLTILLLSGLIGIRWGGATGMAIAQSLAYATTTAVTIWGFIRIHGNTVAFPALFRVSPAEWRDWYRVWRNPTREGRLL